MTLVEIGGWKVMFYHPIYLFGGYLSTFSMNSVVKSLNDFDLDITLNLDPTNEMKLIK